MIFQVRMHVDKEHLVWATFYMLWQGRPTTKRRVGAFLRGQLELFGSVPDSLMGSSYFDDRQESPDYEKAVMLVERWWPNE